MRYYYGHQVLQQKYDCKQNAESLLEFSDRYFEDFLVVKHEDPNTPFLVRTVGLRHCFPNYYFLNRFSDRISLHLILSGKAYSDGIVLQSGDILLLDADHVHNFSSDQNDPCIYAWITFKSSICTNLLSKLGFFNATNITHVENLSEVCKILNEMLYCNHPAENLEISLDASLYQIFKLLKPQNKHNSTQVNTISQYINQSLSFFFKNLDNINLTIADIAKEIGLNETYFRSIFRKEMGMSPKHYLLQYRINSAKTLLLSSKYSIGEISDMVGFRDYRQFYTIFNKYENISPGDYRKKMVASLKKENYNC